MSDRGELVLFWSVIVGVIALVIYACVLNERAWDAYAASHHCRAVGTRRGQVVNGIGTNGQITTSVEPDQTVYACDGGEIQIR